MSAEYQQPGSYAEEVLFLPLDALGDFDGRNDACVVLEATTSGTVLAKWEDAGIPHLKEYAGEDLGKLPPFPEFPESMAVVETSLVKALDDASHVAAPLAARYAALLWAKYPNLRPETVRALMEGWEQQQFCSGMGTRRGY